MRKKKRATAVPRQSAAQVMRLLPMEQDDPMDYATLDHHRLHRKGFSEVVYCPCKTSQQVASIMHALSRHSPRVLGTRASVEQFEAAKQRVPDLQYNAVARAMWLDREPAKKKDGVVVVAAGTGDLSVAEEAAVTLEVMGHQAKRIWDVGVAGLHRLLDQLPALREARVVVVVAGMEGALPSVVAGLVAAPVIAVPTSVGYGASFGGVAALLAMLNSCAPGIAVVNIDNGFGAGYMAAVINGQANGRLSVSVRRSRAVRGPMVGPGTGRLSHESKKGATR